MTHFDDALPAADRDAWWLLILAGLGLLAGWLVVTFAIGVVYQAQWVWRAVGRIAGW